jgi:methionine transaminase
VPEYKGTIKSKLPQTGTSIFAVMSQMANEYGAFNLSQGFPDFEISGGLISLVNHYMRKGLNQYAPMTGVPLLRERIAAKIKKAYKVGYDPDSEINVTAGATQAIYTAIAAMVHDEDEVIIFEPAYDSYAPAVKLSGGIVKYVGLEPPAYRVNWEEVSRLLNHRTRMIIINSPHNPTGSILREEDMRQLVNLTNHTDIVILSDEVYEHLIYDGYTHESVCKYPELARRSFVTGSFGKTFHATGWKMGYVLAPAGLMREFRKAHQFIVFTCNTPVQHAIADYLGNEENYAGLGDFFQEKRDDFAGMISGSRFKLIPTYGTYFQLVDYSSISDEPEMEFAKRLVKEFGIATIPVSPFYHRGDDHKVLRLCFAKKKETLEIAAEILCRI